jgi:hypothetical protein
MAMSGVIGVCSAALIAGLSGSNQGIGAGDAMVFPAPGDRPVAVTREGVLNLRSGDVDIGGVADELAQGDGAFAPGWHVMVLDGPMTPERRGAMEAIGLRIGDYLPTNAFAVEPSGSTRGAVRGLGFVTRAMIFADAWKIDPEIGRLPLATQERQAIALAGNVALNVVLFPGETVRDAGASLGTIQGVQVIKSEQTATATSMTVIAPAGSVNAIAALPSVQMVEDAEEWVERNNTTVRWVVQSNTAGVTPFYTAGITGTGQVVGHLDSGVSSAVCSMTDTVPIGPTHRKILFDGAPSSSTHGTMTATIILGKNLSNPTDVNTGIAYDAKLVHNSTPSLDTTGLFTRFSDFYTGYGAAIHSNSWGQDFTTAYKAGVRAIDDFSFFNDDNIVVFAVTNQSGSMYIPENAKNCIGVGGTAQANNQNNWGVGGTGPTADGRRKPDIMAPGQNYISTASGTCTTSTGTGTSFACPSVAGAATLARQYFTDGYYPTGTKVPSDGFTPSGALVKAAVINGGADLSDSGYPGNREGWGRVWLDRTFYFPGDNRTMLVRDVRNNSAKSLTTGQSGAVRFKVNTNQLLRATLTWADYPAAVNATVTPVNNLNLSLVAPGGTYLGNVFSGGVSATGGTADALNNVEQVHLSTPTPGVYVLRVNAAAVQQQSQGYAIVIAGDVSPCIGDVNQDGEIDLTDFFQFLNDFDQTLGTADIDGVDGVDLGDFFAFLNAFDTGC